MLTAQASENIGAAGFYVASPNSPYTIKIYTGVTAGNPASGTLRGTTTGVSATAGYHTFTLSTPVPVTQGGLFSVVVTLTTPGYNSPVSVEYSYPNYSSHASAHPGESFVSTNGTSWTDATTIDSTMNVCLKAYATATSNTTVSVTVTTNPIGQPMFVDNASVATPHTFTWTVGSSHSISVTTPQTSGSTRYVYANWSDGGAVTHTITTPSSDTTYTASFITQYLLSLSVTPSGAGTATVLPASEIGRAHV